MQAVQSGLWELPPTSLPDANTWPTWGALRERILTATKQINILGSAAVRDNFLSELVKLSPPELHTLVRIVTLACCSMVIQQFIVCVSSFMQLFVSLVTSPEPLPYRLWVPTAALTTWLQSVQT